jgi:hypothetical protein
MEAGIVALIVELAPATSGWMELPVVVQLGVVSFLHHRFMELRNKVTFVFKMYWTHWTLPKMRTSFSGTMLLVSLALFPLVLVVILVGVWGRPATGGWRVSRWAWPRREPVCSVVGADLEFVARFFSLLTPCWDRLQWAWERR